MGPLPESQCDNAGGGDEASHGRAEQYCEDCRAKLCQPCLNQHNNTHALSNHRLVPLSRKDEPTIRYLLCPDHQIYFNYFCHTCRKAMCRVCAAKNHTHHEAVTLKALNNDKCKELRTFLDHLANMVTDFNKKKDEPGKMEAEAKSLIEAAENDYVLHRDKCRAALREWERSMEENLEQGKRQLQGDVERVLGERRQFLQVVHNLEDKIQYLLALKRPLEVVEKTPEVELQLETLRSQERAVFNDSFVRGIKLAPTQPPGHYGQIKAFNVGPASDREKLLFWTKKKPQTEEELKNYCASDVGNLLSPCDVLIMPDGELLVNDWGNARVQRFLSTGAMATVVLKDVTPERLALTPDGLLAVTDDKERRVVILSPDGEVVKRWEPEGLARPWALAVTQDGRWIISDVTSSQCNIYSPEGELLVRIAGQHENKNEDGYVDQPSYVTCDVIGRILVSDVNRHCVNVYSQEGEFLLKVGGRGTEDGKLLYPRGVCVDEANYILVADWGNDRISQFSPEGKFVQHVLTSVENPDFGWPYGLSYLSGTVAERRPRLAVVGEGPDALIVMPYHHQVEVEADQEANVTSDTVTNREDQDLDTPTEPQHRPGKIRFKTRRSSRSSPTSPSKTENDEGSEEGRRSQLSTTRSAGSPSHKGRFALTRSADGVPGPAVSSQSPDIIPRNRRIVSQGSNANNQSRRSTPDQGQSQGRRSRFSTNGSPPHGMDFVDTNLKSGRVTDPDIMSSEFDTDYKRPKTARSSKSSRSNKSVRSSASDLPDLIDPPRQSARRESKNNDLNQRSPDHPPRSKNNDLNQRSPDHPPRSKNNDLNQRSPDHPPRSKNNDLNQRSPDHPPRSHTPGLLRKSSTISIPTDLEDNLSLASGDSLLDSTYIPSSGLSARAKKGRLEVESKKQ